MRGLYLGAPGPGRLPPGQQELLDLPGLPDHAAPVRVSYLDPVQEARGDLQVSQSESSIMFTDQSEPSIMLTDQWGSSIMFTDQ